MLGLCFAFTLNVIAQSSTKSTDIEIVNAYLTAAFNKNFNEQRLYMHDSIIDYHPTVLQKPAKGKDELTKGWKDSFNNMDSVQYVNLGDGKVQINNGNLKGNWILTIGELHTIVKGVNAKSQMIGLYRIRDQRIVEVRNYGNILDIYLQLGFTLQPPKN